MQLDLLDWLLIGGFGGIFVLFGLLIGGIRLVGKHIVNIQGNLGKVIENYVWVDHEELVDGVKRTVRRVNPAVQANLEALVPALMPILMKSGMEYIQKNVKFNPQGQGGAGMGLGEGLANMFLKGKQKAFAGPLGGMIEGVLSRFLPGMTGGSSGGGGSAQVQPIRTV